MTERLYYTDAYLREFDASVVRVDRRDGRTAVVLDRTAFYPTSGGQPFDIGEILVERPFQGRGRGVDVIDDDTGDIAHVIDGEAPPQGAAVHGAVDWMRRFDHMQQHTGQHVLSAAIDRLFGVRTVSFHLGTDASTIDLSRELTRDEIVSAELEANRIVWENHPVAIRYASAEEAAKLPLRKESVREGTLRLIDIEHFDLSACGGTHVSRTGAIGIIAIAGAERFKSGMRVEFVCGGRALRAYRGLKNSVAGGVRLLSVLPEDLPAAIEKFQSAGRTQQTVQQDLQEQLAVHEAAALAAKGQTIGKVTLVAEALSGWDANGLKKLASAITSKPGMLAVLVTAEAPALVVAARSPDVAIDAGEILKTLIERFGGKGGGKGAMAQGGGLNGAPADMLTAARDMVTRLV